MKKVMFKKPKTKEFLVAVVALGGVYAVGHLTSESVSIGLIWTSIAALAGGLGILAMKVFNVTY